MITNVLLRSERPPSIESFPLVLAPRRTFFNWMLSMSTCYELGRFPLVTATTQGPASCLEALSILRVTASMSLSCSVNALHT